MSKKDYKNIVNPHPEFFTDQVTAAGSGGRNGRDYDYSNARNKWVIEGIHDSYINYGKFPVIGEDLVPSGPVTDRHKKITLGDAMAYAAVYPQNAIIKKLPLPKNDEEYITIFDFHPLSEKQRNDQLANMYTRITEETNGDMLITLSTKEALNPGNDSDEPNIAYMRLTVIPYQSSQARTFAIRRSFKLQPFSPALGSPLEPAANLKNSIMNKQPDDLNFNDWTKNLTADRKSSVIYFNNRDKNMYYIVRTNDRDIRSFDEKGKNSTIQARKRKLFIGQGVNKLLSYLGIDFLPSKEISDLTQAVSILDRGNFLSRYGDSDRPSAPNGVGVWLLGLRIPFNTFVVYLEGTNVPNEEEGGQ
tara:strand:- start:31 stop:1110 length:1080 start_codon:yes stop_codon:yes gene_type:complete